MRGRKTTITMKETITFRFEVREIALRFAGLKPLLEIEGIGPDSGATPSQLHYTLHSECNALHVQILASRPVVIDPRTCVLLVFPTEDVEADPGSCHFLLLVCARRQYLLMSLTFGQGEAVVRLVRD